MLRRSRVAPDAGAGLAPAAFLDDAALTSRMLDTFRALEVAERISGIADLPGAAMHRHAVAGHFASTVGTPPTLPFRLPVLPSDPTPGLPPVRAQTVVIGRVLTDRLRFRAFYPELGLTMAVHDGLARWTRSELLSGSRESQRFGGMGMLVAPRVVARHRSPSMACLVEEMLPGTAMTPEGWTEAARIVGRGLADHWLRRGVRHRPLSAAIKPIALQRLHALELEEAAAWDGLPNLVGAVERLTKQDTQVLVGPCHGDPVRGNVLRLDDGRLALVDWETAGRRPLAHDVMKLIFDVSDPLAAGEEIGRYLYPLMGPRSAPWREQMAAALLDLIAGWPSRRREAQRLGKVPAYQRRIRRRLQLLADLLADGAVAARSI